VHEVSAAATPSASFGPVTVYFGEKSGKYPDGNLVVVRGGDSTVIFPGCWPRPIW
jgi:hypothetical protein